MARTALDFNNGIVIAYAVELLTDGPVMFGDLLEEICIRQNRKLSTVDWLKSIKSAKSVGFRTWVKYNEEGATRVWIR